MSLLDDIDAAHKPLRNKDFTPVFYEYTAREKETIFLIAVRAGLDRYDTLASINRLDASNVVLEGKTLLIPACPGLFVPCEPESELEYLMSQRYAEADKKEMKKILVKNTEFWYNMNDKFSAEERAFFLDSSMKLPLKVKEVVLTSPFGRRKSPITGAWQDHKGVDLAARTGDQVFACGAGSVSFAGWDDILGNYVLIDHPGGRQSLYAHLSKIVAVKDQAVKTGTLIGEVGETGAATGPHLHFEIRINGKAQDPRNSVEGLR